MSAESEIWRTFCATIAAYRRQHRSWPNRAMLPRRAMEDLQQHLGPEKLAQVQTRLRLFPSHTEKVLVYDEQCQIVDAPEEVTPAELESVLRWLGVREPEP